MDVISSVSGGSFTAAYYGLFGDQLFEDFETVFLRRNVQSELLAALFNPLRWFSSKGWEATTRFDFERLLGKRPPTWTTDDLVALAKDQGVRVVSLMHIGGDGWLKTLDFVPRSVGHLSDVIQGGDRAELQLTLPMAMPE